GMASTIYESGKHEEGVEVGFCVRRVVQALMAAAFAAAAAAQTDPIPSPSPKVTRLMAAGPQYRAGAFHRLLFGAHYRTVWATPITVEVLDLATFSGGLVPERKGGGKQTKSLKLRGGDGREWKF